MTSNVAFHVAPLRHPAARQYEAEWRRLRDDPGALRRAAGWRVAGTEPGSLDDVLRAIGYERASTSLTESNLRRLVGLAADDELAAQVVVRRLLPGALSVAVRHWSRLGPDALGEVLGALWISVRTFDQNRHPASLAGALLRDAEHRAFRAGTRRRLREVPSARVDDRPAPGADADPADELAELVAHAAAVGLADADDIALLQLLVDEPSPSLLAGRLAVTERTIRNRRARLAAKLRAAALAA